jgi:cell division protein FtsB
MVPVEIVGKTKKMAASIYNKLLHFKKYFILALVLLVVLSLAFSIFRPLALSKKILKYQNELDSLSLEINKIKTDNEKLTEELQSFNELRVKILTDLAINKLKLEQYSKAIFNPLDTNKGFARLDTSTGMFFLILDKTEQFESGYKLFFRLGNPQNCVYSGCKVAVKWGQKYDRENKELSHEDWEKSLKNNEVSIKEILIPGQWCSFDITFSPAKPEDIQYIELKVLAEQISMQKDKD